MTSMIRVALLLEPVFDRLTEELRRRSILHADETTLQVLREPGRAAQTQSYLWLYRSSGADGPPIELSDALASKARLVRRPNNEWLIRTKVMEESSMSRKLRKAGSQEIEFTGPEAEQLLLH